MSKLEKGEGVQDKFSEIVELAENEQDPHKLRELCKEYRTLHAAEISKGKDERDSLKLTALSRAIRIMEAKLRGSKRVFKWK
jgi:hypothetical protein